MIQIIINLIRFIFTKIINYLNPKAKKAENQQQNTTLHHQFNKQDQEDSFLFKHFPFQFLLIELFPQNY